MASSNQQPVHHFLLVPLMSQSHLIPFTDLAKVLADHGQQVTIVMTPLNAARFNNAIIDYAMNFNLKIQFLLLSFPGQEAGLPKGCENLDSLPSLDLTAKFFQASNMLHEPLEKWLQDLESLPSCIISDICLPWTSDLALKFKIPRVVFHTVSCFTLLCSHNIKRYEVQDGITSDSEPVLVPGVPDRIEFTKAQLPESQRKSSDDLNNLVNQFKEAELSASAVLVNSFEEMESGYVKAYQKFVNNLWCIGPLSLCNETTSNKLRTGNKTSIDEHESLNWLNSHKSRSVIYVCFGSLSHMLPPQLIELGLGLEASNCPFIWTIKKIDYTPELEKWFKEQRFEERIKGRGLIIRGWAPQVQILSHPATGGFFTHCGWNSTIEGVSAGLPMITWPMFAEQFYNEKFVVQILKIGVKIGVEVPMNAKVLTVKREDVKKAIKQLVDGGDDAEERRKRAKKLGEMAKRAVEKGGSSYLNATLLIEHVNQQGKSYQR
ncbi:UDP-glycosyltransferase 73C3-like [Durio zibethinus]|uniref:Glycosyltransferase n=1 Tax=Durio zibethinus TaxID=66656 RepID=A0A6P5YYX6_DURZI|nr:UDP-glycosyltransferase 73C3-like [Durio zibethinus]